MLHMVRVLIIDCVRTHNLSLTIDIIVVFLKELSELR